MRKSHDPRATSSENSHARQISRRREYGEPADVGHSRTVADGSRNPESNKAYLIFARQIFQICQEVQVHPLELVQQAFKGRAHVGLYKEEHAQELHLEDHELRNIDSSTKGGTHTSERGRPEAGKARVV